MSDRCIVICIVCSCFNVLMFHVQSIIELLYAINHFSFSFKLSGLLLRRNGTCWRHIIADDVASAAAVAVAVVVLQSDVMSVIRVQHHSSRS